MKRLSDIITLSIITANGSGVSWSALWSWWVHRGPSAFWLLWSWWVHRDPSAFWLRENALILFGHNPRYQHINNKGENQR